MCLSRSTITQPWDEPTPTLIMVSHSQNSHWKGRVWYSSESLVHYPYKTCSNTKSGPVWKSVAKQIQHFKLLILPTLPTPSGWGGRWAHTTEFTLCVGFVERLPFMRSILMRSIATRSTLMRSTCHEINSHEINLSQDQLDFIMLKLTEKKTT